ncbi:MAG TPA: hypothetical protein VKH81_02780 [Candidatus Angelobacter sp.]|nr:hypothetical protein [Candidatus Angelobacter sp.]
MRNRLLTACGIAILLALSSIPVVYPTYNWDALGYLGNVYLLDGMSLATAHAKVYAEAEGVKDPEARVRLLTDPDAAVRARDPNSFAQYLPFYSIRPAYIGAAYLFYKAGVPPFRSLMLISSISYFFIGMIVFSWIRRYVSHGKAWAVTLLIMLPFLRIAREATPDKMSCAVLLLACYMIAEQKAYWQGIVLLLAALLVRTDNVLVLAAMVCFLWLSKQVKTIPAAAACAGGAAIVLLLNHFSGTFGWKFLIQQYFYGPFPYPVAMTPHLTAAMYSHALTSSSLLVLKKDWYLLAALVVVLALRGPLHTLLLVVLTASAFHFLLFPSIEFRYYLLSIVVAAIAGVLTWADRGSQAENAHAMQSALAPGEVLKL